MGQKKGLKHLIIPFGVATLAAIVLSVIVLMVINAGLARMPVKSTVKATGLQTAEPSAVVADPAKEQAVIKERNLFRARLDIEIPKPKSEAEIEEEMLTAIVKDMTLKGVWIGQQKQNSYAIIDKGGQKGVWNYEAGEVVEKGLTVRDIQQNSVKIVKGDFTVTLRLFAKGYERGPVSGVAKRVETGPAVKPKADIKPVKPLDFSKDVRQEGGTVVISKTLIDKIKQDNSMVMSSVAVKASVDNQGKTTGYQVVAVDKGSLAEKVGIRPGDVVQDVNGVKLSTSADMTSVVNKFKNESKFAVRILRKGSPQTLYYEVR